MSSKFTVLGLTVVDVLHGHLESIEAKKTIIV
jgi:hypothetical protein